MKIVPSWGNFFRPAEHDWGPNSAIIGRSFSTRATDRTIGIRVWGLRPSVVRQIDHDGISREFATVQLLKEIATGLIPPCDHCEVFGDRVGASGLLKATEKFRGRIVRSVRKKWGIP